MEAKSPRGTSDILPGPARVWQRIEKTVAQVMASFDYHEVRTPVFEHTELFTRGVGSTTDIVEKQMYTFDDRGGRSVTLRPEGTAPVVRAYIQHRLHGQGLPQKFWYIQPMFRYERPQAGRGRQFHQFGAESLGSLDPVCDVEMISIPVEVYRRLGITGFRVLLNSIGCPKCRPGYRSQLRDFLQSRIDSLCPTCQSRLERNPLRVLDCKSESCRRATDGAPASVDHLCDECDAHFAQVRRLLDTVHLPYTVDNRLVRGLDYYTKTVFEVVTSALGAQDALAAGGRYDGLAEELGGPPTPAVGFGAGMERAYLVLEKLGLTESDRDDVDVFLISLGADARLKAVEVAWSLRSAGVKTTFDYTDDPRGERSLRGQMKAAGKSGAKLALIIGEDELARGRVIIKAMASGEQRDVDLEAVVPQVLHELGGGGDGAR